MGQIAENQKIAFNQTEGMLNIYEKRLISAYRGSLKQIRNDIMKLNEKVTWSFSELRKYNRLEKLQKQVANELVKLGRLTGVELAKVNTNIVENTYNRSWFGYEKEIKTSLAFGKINPDLVKGIVTEPYPNVKLKDLIKNVTQQQVNRIVFDIGQSLALGEGAAKAARRLRNSLNIGFNQSMRIARTEGLRASSKAQLVSTERSQDLGIEITKQWHTNLDGRERSSHRNINEQLADKKGLFHIGTATAEAPRLFGIAKEDINCRCYYTEEIDDLPENIEKRVTPKSIDKSRQMTFDDFQEEKGIKKNKEVPKAKEPKEPRFKPARTVDEAVKFAKNNNIAKQIDYNGISLEHINAINKTLIRLKEKYKQPFPYIQLNTKMGEGATAGANAVQLKLNKRAFSKNSIREMYHDTHTGFKENTKNSLRLINENDKRKLVSEQEAKRYKETLTETIKFKRSNTAFKGEEINTIITHEFGHTLADIKLGLITKNPVNKLLRSKGGSNYIKKSDELIERLDSLFDKYVTKKTDGYIYDVSVYATENKDEFLAENFVLWDKNPSLVKKDISKFFKDLVELL